MPLFLESLATKILEAGKYLHTIRECGRSPENPMARSATPPLQYSTDTRELGAAIEAAHKWAAAELMRELMVGGRLMERLASVKHYFLLDQASATPSPHKFVPAFAPPRPLTPSSLPSTQGDFFVHFLDSAEEELVKPVAQIAKGRLQSKLELSLRQVCGAAATTSTSTTSTTSTFTSTSPSATLRQAAVADAFKDALGCELAPYNLTNQLLRVINTMRGSGVAPPPQAADRTPGLDAFTFDYKVEWPLSLVLSKNSITKCYPLLFRHPSRHVTLPSHRPHPHPSTLSGTSSSSAISSTANTSSASSRLHGSPSRRPRPWPPRKTSVRRTACASGCSTSYTTSSTT